MPTLALELPCNQGQYLGRRVYIAYLDDSGSTGGNLADSQSPFQVVTSVLFADAADFTLSEYMLGNIIDQHVPEEMRDAFEFHASDLWNCRKPFESLTKNQAVNIIQQCFDLIRGTQLPISFGAVDKRKLQQQIYSTANPIDMAFRLCVEGVESEMHKRESALDRSGAVGFSELAVLICDESKAYHYAIKNAFRQYRRKIRSLERHNRGRLKHIVDDIFFGDSSDSIGIQIADICGFAIGRHLRQQEDTEYLYEGIKNQIYSAKVFPE